MITITKSTNSFIYGKCVQVAVCEAFDEKMSTIDKCITKMFGERDDEDGYTDEEVDLLCKEIGRRNNVDVKSIILCNQDSVTVMGATGLFPGALIVTTEFHCLYIEDHVIYDTLVLIKPAFLFERITGIWSIKKDLSKSIKKSFKDFITIDESSNTVNTNMNETLITAMVVNDLLNDSNLLSVQQLITGKMLSVSPALNHLLSNYLIV